MSNYKEVSFLISSLFVIYFFKDIITTLIILAILSSISALLMKVDYDNDDSTTETLPRNTKNTNIKANKESPKYTKSSNFVYNK